MATGAFRGLVEEGPRVAAQGILRQGKTKFSSSIF